jgi:hypothetical protein
MILTLQQIAFGTNNNIVRKIKSRRMRWAKHLTCMRTAMHTGFWRENVREREQFGRPGHKWEDNIKTDLSYI